MPAEVVAVAKVSQFKIYFTNNLKPSDFFEGLFRFSLFQQGLVVKEEVEKFYPEIVLMDG